MKPIKRIIIEEPGDLTVGLFPSRWEITGDEMELFDERELMQFKEALRHAFEFVASSPVIVTTIDEEQEREKALQWYEEIKGDKAEPVNFMHTRIHESEIKTISPVNCGNPLWDSYGCPLPLNSCNDQCEFYIGGPIKADAKPLQCPYPGRKCRDC